MAMFNDRDTQVVSGGSFTLGFADQVLFDYAEYFNHVNELLVKNPDYESGRTARADILYESLFISIFSYLEVMTGRVCEDLATILHQKIRLKDINERSKFEGTRKYLELLANVEFPTDRLFENLVLYRKARNAIVHGNGLIHLKEKEQKAVECLHGVERDGDGFLNITPEFIEGVLEFCRNYVRELKAIANEIAHRAKSKATIVT